MAFPWQSEKDTVQGEVTEEGPLGFMNMYMLLFEVLSIISLTKVTELLETLTFDTALSESIVSTPDIKETSGEPSL